MSGYDANPVGVLQERFQSEDITSHYKLTYSGGSSHVATFTFQVSLGDFEVSGTGSSKKQAKREAALSMLGVSTSGTGSSKKDTKKRAAQSLMDKLTSMARWVQDYGESRVLRLSTARTTDPRRTMRQEWSTRTQKQSFN